MDFFDELLKNEDVIALLNGKMTETKYKGIMQDLRDMGRLALGYNTFQKKFDEYSKDPLKQKKNRNRIKEARQKAKEAIDRATNRKKAQGHTREDWLNMSPEERQKERENLKEDRAADAAQIAVDEDVKKAEKVAKSIQRVLNSRDDLDND